MVPPDGELEFKKINLVDSTIDSGPINPVIRIRTIPVIPSNPLIDQ